MKKIDTIIEARIGSKRLPGKVMYKINGIPIIELLVNRVKKVKSAGRIIIATSINKLDDEIIKWAKKKRVLFYRGNEEDVMSRVLNAAKYYKVKHILNITGDCPLIDPQLISQFINIYNSNNCEYLNNCKFRTYPIGMDIQIYPTKILEKSFKLTKKKKHREHVTLHMLENPNLFKHLNIIAPPEIFFPKLGLTLDEIDDYKLIKKIFLNFFRKKNSFTCLDIINYLNQKPKLKLINIRVKRKKK